MLFASVESNGGKHPSLNSGRALTALSVEFKDTESLQEVNIIQIHKYTQYSNFHIRKLFCSKLILPILLQIKLGFLGMV